MKKTRNQLLQPHNLLRCINSYYRTKIVNGSGSVNRDKLILLEKNIDIWLKFFPSKFKSEFLGSLDIPRIGKIRYRHTPNIAPQRIEKELNLYIGKLVADPSFKIFIGKDAYILYLSYKKELQRLGKKDNSCFIRYSRSFLFDKSNDNNYIQLTELIHNGDIFAISFPAFYREYRKNLLSRDGFYEHVRKKTLSLLTKHHIINELNTYKSFTVVDSGMQGGLAVLLMAVLREEGYKGSMSLFFCFPWLSKLYKGKIQTHNIDIFVQLEHTSMHAYAKAGHS